MLTTYPSRESLVSDIPVGDGKIANLFLQCTGDTSFMSSVILSMLVKAWIWTVYSICVMHMKFSRPDSHAGVPHIYLCLCMTSVSHSCHENPRPLPSHQFKPVCFHCFALWLPSLETMQSQDVLHFSSTLICSRINCFRFGSILHCIRVLGDGIRTGCFQKLIDNLETIVVCIYKLIIFG